MQHRFVIEGRLVSLKNDKVIRRRRNGTAFPGKGERVKAWQQSAALQLATQHSLNSPPIVDRGQTAAASITGYMAKGQKLDIDAVSSAPLDALEAAGILWNDGLVDAMIVKRHKDWARPRVEIVIEVRS